MVLAGPSLLHALTSAPQVLSRAVVVAVLLLCAVGVTKLMKMSRDSATKIVWKSNKLNEQVGHGWGVRLGGYGLVPALCVGGMMALAAIGAVQM